MDTNDFLLKEECYQVIGCAMKVHSELGNGFLEAVYQEALMIEFSESRVPFEKEKPLVINYKGSTLNKRYYADFICYDELIVEVKATDGLHTEHTAQVLNYLKATGHHVGLLLNFGTTKLQYKRVIL
ncbi:GxxExxY protein [Penaeicola halotolerans]|uniref:GxxExxY protein n=1 Tax=Penaeicola halotolerans TaxID=2793196 RepID=UPI001CF87346|nr:GxxExxY protein [Penaeicola halotolerans]